jgi:coenzyme PQQ precursor peptide PqqA
MLDTGDSTFNQRASQLPASPIPKWAITGASRGACTPVRSDLDYCRLQKNLGKTTMAWTTPTLVEICIGLEINGYLPAEF